MVAPNGSRRTKADHPALPITADEILACAVTCYAAGADGLHTHIRDAAGGHLLDADIYRDLLHDLRRAVPDMSLQITTEAEGIYAPDAQMAVALGAGADMVSAAIREITRAGREPARAFYQECEQQGIAIQHILYGREDCDLLQETLPGALMRAQSLQLLFVLGRYSQSGASSPEELDPFLSWLQERDLSPDWAVCAFGAAETRCLVTAVQKGGKCRVGFENSLVLSDGRIAPDNAEKTRDLLQALKLQGRRGGAF